MSNNEKIQEIQDLLRNKNIKNNDFFTAHRIFAEGINPFSPCEKEQEDLKKLSKDLWYFTFNLVKIQQVGAKDLAFYELNRQNLAVLYLLKNNLSVYTNSCRASYNTTTRICYYLWRMVNDPTYSFRILSTNINSSIHTFKKLESVNEQLPSCLRVNNLRERVRLMSTLNCDDNRIKDLFGEDVSDILIQDFENIDKIGKVMKLLNPLIEKEGLRVDCVSTIGKSGSNGKIAGDRVIMDSYRWFEEMYDIENLNRIFDNKIIYVKYDFRDLFPNPDYWYYNISKCYNGNKSTLDREINLIR